MYPPVTQFQTHDAHVRHELELRRGRRRAAQSVEASARPWWLRLKLALVTARG
jgi:hypothetical protein